jgi:cytochrome oxidase Cu insertion factor (SCO1/SenC/PrrC family)
MPHPINTRILAIVLAMAFLSTPAVAPSEITPVAARRAAPAFSLKNQKDETVSLAQFRGKVILVNFWATVVPRLQTGDSVVYGVCRKI